MRREFEQTSRRSRVLTQDDDDATRKGDFGTEHVGSRTADCGSANSFELKRPIDVL